jgi:hypothetical protein
MFIFYVIALIKLILNEVSACRFNNEVKCMVLLMCKESIGIECVHLMYVYQ